jgi:uncharacterized protein (TIGR04255 family)
MPDSLSPFRLEKAPIIEAVVNIVCDLPPTYNRGEFQSAAQKQFADKYPEFRTIQEQHFAFALGVQPKSEVREAVRGYQAVATDKKQIVQSLFDGFSFNRLAPYGGLDDYLSEIGRCWDIYRGFARPVIVKRIALRFINRVPLPLTEGKIDIERYLKVGPTVPDGDIRLGLTGFTHENRVAELNSENLANVVLAAQPPEASVLPVIFDIDAYRNVRLAPEGFDTFMPIVSSLRALKNQIFRNTLTEECLRYLQQHLP